MLLRDYQQRAVEHIQRSAGNPLLISPTGSGKTVTLAAGIRPDATVLAHRRELIAQLRSTFAAFGKFPTVSTWQAYRQRPYVEQLVIDEAHHVAPGTAYARIIDELRAINPRLQVVGATATPWRLDGKCLPYFDDPHVAITPGELLAAGVLVPYTGFAYRHVDTNGVRKVAGDYATGDLARASMQILGDIVTRWKATASNLSTLVFAVNVAHAEALCAEFRAQGVHAEYLTGQDATPRRDRLFAALANRALPVLVNVAIATEGVDIPSLECLVLARPTLSETLALQMLGRVLRSSPGKVAARIHDHAQILETHGSPYAERDWSPRPDRKRGPSDGGGSQQICSECLALISASCRVCPVCGAELRPPKAVEPGEGVEVAISSGPAPDSDGNFEGAYPGRGSFPASTVLDNALASIPLGAHIRVRYLGDRRSATGRIYRNYRVESLLAASELELLNAVS